MYLKKLANFAAGFALALGALFLAADAGAQALMFDFGPVAPADADAANSPGHFTQAIPETDTTWNHVEKADVLSGLKYADGQDAAGVFIRTGVGTPSSLRVIDFAANPNSSAELGRVINTGVYAGNSVGKDGIFNHDNHPPRAIGVQIGGLPPGDYDLYIAGRNTSFGAANPQFFHAVAGAPGDTFDFGGLTAILGENQTDQYWEEGNTYIVIRVSLGKGEVFNLAVEGEDDQGARRGFLNSLQVVPVAEPAPGS